MSNRSQMSDEEKTTLQAAKRQKAMTKIGKENAMTLKALKKKIYKECVGGSFYNVKNLQRVYGIYTTSDPITHAATVHRTYDVPYTPWPLTEYQRWKAKSGNPSSVQVHTASIPLRDYWRLNLQGKGL